MTPFQDRFQNEYQHVMLIEKELPKYEFQLVLSVKFLCLKKSRIPIIKKSAWDLIIRKSDILAYTEDTSKTFTILVIFVIGGWSGRCTGVIGVSLDIYDGNATADQEEYIGDIENYGD